MLSQDTQIEEDLCLLLVALRHLNHATLNAPLSEEPPEGRRG